MCKSCARLLVCSTTSTCVGTAPKPCQSSGDGLGAWSKVAAAIVSGVNAGDRRASCARCADAQACRLEDCVVYSEYLFRRSRLQSFPTLRSAVRKSTHITRHGYSRIWVHRGFCLHLHNWSQATWTSHDGGLHRSQRGMQRPCGLPSCVAVARHFRRQARHADLS